MHDRATRLARRRGSIHRGFLWDTGGISTVEYLIVLCVVALLGFGAWRGFGQRLETEVAAAGADVSLVHGPVGGLPGSAGQSASPRGTGDAVISATPGGADATRGSSGAFLLGAGNSDGSPSETGGSDRVRSGATGTIGGLPARPTSGATPDPNLVESSERSIVDVALGLGEGAATAALDAARATSDALFWNPIRTTQACNEVGWGTCARNSGQTIVAAAESTVEFLTNDPIGRTRRAIADRVERRIAIEAAWLNDCGQGSLRSCANSVGQGIVYGGLAVAGGGAGLGARSSNAATRVAPLPGEHGAVRRAGFIDGPENSSPATGPALHTEGRMTIRTTRNQALGEPVGCGAHLCAYRGPDGKIYKEVSPRTNIKHSPSQYEYTDAQRAEIAREIVDHNDRLANRGVPVPRTRISEDSPFVVVQDEARGIPRNELDPALRDAVATRSMELELARAQRILGPDVQIDPISRNFLFDPDTGLVSDWFDPTEPSVVGTRIRATGGEDGSSFSQGGVSRPVIFNENLPEAPGVPPPTNHQPTPRGGPSPQVAGVSLVEPAPQIVNNVPRHLDAQLDSLYRAERDAVEHSVRGGYRPGEARTIAYVHEDDVLVEGMRARRDRSADIEHQLGPGMAYDVLVHGQDGHFFPANPAGGMFRATPRQLADNLVEQGYAGGPIRLTSCHAGRCTNGDSSAAQGLADALYAHGFEDVTVVAANRAIVGAPEGQLAVVRDTIRTENGDRFTKTSRGPVEGVYPQGRWRLFVPNTRQ